MGLNYILLWLVPISIFMQGFTLRQAPPSRRRGWYQILMGLLVLWGFGFALFPEEAGLVSGGAWGLAILLPALLRVRLQRRLSTGRLLRSTVILSRFMAVLHPLDDWPDTALYLRALFSLREEPVEEARVRLHALRSGDCSLAKWSLLAEKTLDAEWQPLLDVLSTPQCASLRRNHLSRGQVLRALGELGRHSELLHEARHLGLHPPSQRNAFELLMLCAFFGEVSLARRFVTNPRLHYSSADADFWIASAQQSSGLYEQAEETFRRLLGEASLGIRRASLRRLEGQLPLCSRDQNTSQLQFFQALEAQLQSFEALPAPSKPRRAWVTQTIVGLLLVAFLIELPGGSEDLDNLLELGMLVFPQTIESGEWWRFLTASFLHFGPLHLLLNTGALLLFGRDLERHFKPLPFLFLYVASTAAGFALVAAFSEATSANPEGLIGASGGVMGLVGAALSLAFVRWRKKRTLKARLNLFTLLGMVIFQVLFDIATPQVSQAAHLGGLGAGLSLSFAWIQLRSTRASSARFV